MICLISKHELKIIIRSVSKGMEIVLHTQQVNNIKHDSPSFRVNLELFLSRCR